jgi:hypothetical protein
LNKSKHQRSQQILIQIEFCDASSLRRRRRFASCRRIVFFRLKKSN